MQVSRLLARIIAKLRQGNADPDDSRTLVEA
jgi:hypothetical protein